MKINIKNTLTDSDMSKLIDTKNASNPWKRKSLKQNVRKRKINRVIGKMPLIALVFAFIGLLSVSYASLGTTTANNVSDTFSGAVFLLENDEITLDEFVNEITDEMSEEEIDEELNMYISDLIVIEKTEQQIFEDKLFDFISKWEWAFQPNAFCDSYYKTKKWLIRKSGKDCTRWSIWYWTKSYWGEVITYEEWVRRRNEDIRHRNSLIKSDCLTENQRIATVDFMYQHWSNSSWIKGYANRCESNKIYNTIVWYRDRYRSQHKWGLVKREQMRINYFYN